MPSITKSQAEKKQAQLENSWKFSVRSYVFGNGYEINQYVKLSDDKYLKFEISFAQHCINPEETRGYMREYAGYDVIVRKSEWTVEKSGGMSSHGLGIRKLLKENVGNKQAFKILADISKQYTVEDIRSMYTGQEKNALGFCSGYSLLSA